MKLIEFFKHYPDEESCKIAFKSYRLQEGVTCKKCGSTSHYWKKNREQWECKSCKHRTTLKSGTVMQSSKLPYQYWFIAMHLITSTKKSFSAKEIQRQIGHKRYEPIWSMVHKLRSVMGLRDEQYELGEEIELDEGFFETVSITRDKTEPLKRGRGSQRQSTVLVAAESRVEEQNYNPKKHRTKKRVGYLKMTVIESLKKEDLAVVVKEKVKKNTKIVSDKSNSYNNLKEDYNLDSKVVPKKEINTILPWVHTAISNAKRLLLDVHHRIDDDFLQNYLNEYCFKFNRRYFDNIFDRLMVAAVSNRWNYLGEENG
ncbi:IS1595 family transposase [Aquimarina sp. I32.4]|uniref:IS1595 family transposase n=1 Tax=Aquimarina sp. I32.4 TaxID=2053903 RepID=UPI000CDED081|nr:IS1595 family transposase [Aquimarina sp. I32.4]